MSVYSKRVGLRNVGSYQVSGTPWITGSASFTALKTVRHSFPLVTKSFTVINKGSDDIYLHFNSGSLTFAKDGVEGAQTFEVDDAWKQNYHYLTIPASDGSITLDTKTKEIFLSNFTTGSTGAYEIFAELTQIPTASMFHLTGSGITATND